MHEATTGELRQSEEGRGEAQWTVADGDVPSKRIYRTHTHRTVRCRTHDRARLDSLSFAADARDYSSESLPAPPRPPRPPRPRPRAPLSCPPRPPLPRPPPPRPPLQCSFDRSSVSANDRWTVDLSSG